jgi:hypothetical protein
MHKIIQKIQNLEILKERDYVCPLILFDLGNYTWEVLFLKFEWL